ncbi:MAG: 3-hydroxy-3-methylglutaryl-CoA reductase, partial [Poseidonia sp.]
GGFTTNNDAPVMIGQIQLLDVEDIEQATAHIEGAKAELMAFCNDIPSRMIAMGGGCKNIEIRRLPTPMGEML